MATCAFSAMRVLLALVVLIWVVEGKWWMEQLYGDDDFNVRVEYGQEINITCEDPRIGNRTGTVEFWVRILFILYNLIQGSIIGF